MDLNSTDIDSPSITASKPKRINKPTEFLKPKDIAAINLKFQGKTYRQIGEALNIKENTVSTWFMHNGRLKKAYEEHCHKLLNPIMAVEQTTTHTRTVAERLKQYAPTALEKIIDLSRGAKRENVQYQASADIMDRAGYAPVLKTLNVDIVEEMSVNELDALANDIVGKRVTLRTPSDKTVIDTLLGSDDAVMDSVAPDPESLLW